MRIWWCVGLLYASGYLPSTTESRLALPTQPRYAMLVPEISKPWRGTCPRSSISAAPSIPYHDAFLISCMEVLSVGDPSPKCYRVPGETRMWTGPNVGIIGGRACLSPYRVEDRLSLVKVTGNSPHDLQFQICHEPGAALGLCSAARRGHGGCLVSTGQGKMV